MLQALLVVSCAPLVASTCPSWTPQVGTILATNEDSDACAAAGMMAVGSRELCQQVALEAGISFSTSAPTTTNSPSGCVIEMTTRFAKYVDKATGSGRSASLAPLCAMPSNAWYPVDTGELICTDLGASGAQTIRLSTASVVQEGRQNIPRVLSFFRTSLNEAKVTIKVEDAKGNVLFHLDWQLPDLRAKRRLALYSDWLPKPAPPPAPKPPPPGRRRRRGGIPYWSGRIKATAPSEGVVGPAPKKYGWENSAGMGYGYASTATLPGANPVRTMQGYSGAGAYKPSSDNSTAIAGVGSSPSSLYPYYSYSYVPPYYSYASRPSRSCLYGRHWTGSCKNCSDQYSEEACREQAPQLAAARDDYMGFAFDPTLFESPIKVTLSHFSGTGYSPMPGGTICPPRNSSDTWSPSATSDIYLALTMVDALNDPKEEEGSKEGSKDEESSNGQLRCCPASAPLGVILALRLLVHPFLY